MEDHYFQFLLRRSWKITLRDNPSAMIGANVQIWPPSPGLSNPSPGLSNPSPGLSNPSPGLSNPSPGLSNLCILRRKLNSPKSEPHHSYSWVGGPTAPKKSARAAPLPTYAISSSLKREALAVHSLQ